MHFPRLFSIFSTALVLTFAQFSIAYAGNPNAAATLKVVQGEVAAVTPSGISHKVSAGDKIFPTEKVVTADNSAASMVFKDGSTVMLGQNSQFEVKAYEYNAVSRDGSFVSKLLKGSLRMITGLIGKEHHDRIALSTNVVTIGIRGTDFIVEAE